MALPRANRQEPARSICQGLWSAAGVVSLDVAVFKHALPVVLLGISTQSVNLQHLGWWWIATWYMVEPDNERR